MDEGYLDVRHLIVIIILAPIVIFSVALLPIIWRIPADRPVKPRRWRLSNMRTSFIRYLPLNILTLLFLELAAVAGFFEKLWASYDAMVFSITFGWVFVASLVLTVPVWLLNRPKFAVPPGLRNLRGPLELWWLSRKGPVSEVRDQNRGEPEV